MVIYDSKIEEETEEEERKTEGEKIKNKEEG